MSENHYPELHLNPAASARVGRGHLWVFSNEVVKTEGKPVNGAEVAVITARKEFVGTALYNRNSLIAARIFSVRSEPLDGALIERRIRAAVAARAPLAEFRTARRLVFSESDMLPGLIVDQYGDVLSIQILTLGMETRREEILAALKLILAPRAIVERSDTPGREHEGLTQTKGLLYGTLPETLLVDLHGISFRVDVLEGQKTGLYLDQVENWQLLKPMVKGKNVLDLFCHEGGFGLTAAKAGAESVKCVDSSDPALNALVLNANRNGIDRTIKAKNSDGFLYVRSLPDTFDVIICDPPPFARSRKQLEGALRGYREVNRQCLKLLNPGGILLTFSCSAAVGEDDFDKMLTIAAKDAGRTLRVLPGGSQPPDHAPLLAMAETKYLKARIVQALDV